MTAGGVHRVDTYDGCATYWHVTPPDPSVRYVVLEQTWAEGFTERHVYDWQPVVP